MADQPFRQGRRVSRHVYQNDRPLFTADTHEQAACLVRLLNAGHAVAVEQVQAGKVDPVVEAVRLDLLQRSQLGIAKYGTTLGDSGLAHRQLLQHAYEEALDLANYLKGAMMELDRGEPV